MGEMSEALKRVQELKAVTDPVIKYINDNFDPHTKIIVDCDSAEIVQGLATHRNKEFIKD